MNDSFTASDGMNGSFMPSGAEGCSNAAGGDRAGSRDRGADSCAVPRDPSAVKRRDDSSTGWTG